jgi:hypothetical protein
MERGNASYPMAPNIEIHKPIDPHLRRWMLFVDGENLTIRAQKLASDNAVNLQEGAEYRKNVFVWFPGLKATPALTNTRDSPMKGLCRKFLRGDALGEYSVPERVIRRPGSRIVRPHCSLVLPRL